ncbi:N-acetylmuramoyl-L-alanine amidase [Candidatus Oscillochloris fontis]|uniref:N-acetylmuramoyl-L-alanine amidase n=1 Tax=Candidatus Oscillochloris fontis TaxID=2496868 RepID=UPI00101C2D1D|nr:N-acetylmuramoyl-L-alanine amidase [Candidatus Oscillochloris fontis]
MQIERIAMSRPHYQTGRKGRVRMIVLHATAGRGPGDLNWLRAGGDERRPVSTHYYISKQGRIVQLVDDANTAWHAGVSRWNVDGKQVSGCNAYSLGIELENLNNGRDPYPTAQYAAALWLCRTLVVRHDIPRSQLVRHLDIAPGRKSDPAGFPWQRFVGEVYTDLVPETTTPPELVAQLQAHLLDLAYRTAGSGLSAGWPFFTIAQQAKLGMPVAAPTARRTADGTAQDDQDRGILLADAGTFLVEIYAGDLLYAPLEALDTTPPAPTQVQRLSQTPAGPLRDALLELLFRQADPVNGYRPDWAHHQHVLKNLASLGVPIGPNQRLTISNGTAYVCQHFAYDSLCSPVPNWKTIYRLSELSAVVAGKRRISGLTTAQATLLRRTLLDSLYREQAGRQFEEQATLVRYALDTQIGAPLGAPEELELGEAHFLLMPFAKDVIACRLPSADWAYDRPVPTGTTINGLAATLGAADENDIGCLREYVAGRTRMPGTIAGQLLGQALAHPRIHDLSRWHDAPQPPQAISQIVLWPTLGPAASDLTLPVVAFWHYYIQCDGTIIRLRDAPATTHMIIASEGDVNQASPRQRSALAWLLRILHATCAFDLSQIRIGVPR